MEVLNLDDVYTYVNENIVDFHRRKIQSLEKLRLNKLLTKNPYLFRAKNITLAGDLMKDLLTAYLSSSEEKLFGDFLEGLAIFVASKTCNGRKSAAPGVDMEFEEGNVHYLVSIKSGPNWGNSSQQSKLAEDLQKATTRVKQSKFGVNVQPMLGICYGKTRTGFLRGYLKIVGQNFWYLLSNNKNLYTDIIEPIGYRAKEHNEAFTKEKDIVVNRFTHEFIERFCINAGEINWERLIEFNSGNYDLDKFFS